MHNQLFCVILLITFVIADQQNGGANCTTNYDCNGISIDFCMSGYCLRETVFYGDCVSGMCVCCYGYAGKDCSQDKFKYASFGKGFTIKKKSVIDTIDHAINQLSPIPKNCVMLCVLMFLIFILGGTVCKKEFNIVTEFLTGYKKGGDWLENNVVPQWFNIFLIFNLIGQILIILGNPIDRNDYSM